MKILTVVIPSYNTEKFIDKNMKYFLDERIYEDVEILIINDGSQDGTAEKAKQYVEKYPDYIRLINKENGGHGSVINRGIQEAQGKYFKVVDADDWVDTENFVKLVFFLRNPGINADVVLNPYKKIHAVTKKVTESHFPNKAIYGELYLFDDIIKDKLAEISLHGVTFRTEVLNKIHLTEKCFYDDYQYSFYTVPYLNTALILDYPIYVYLIGQADQSTSDASVLKHVDMALKVYQDSVFYFSHTDIPKNRIVYIDKSILGFGRSIYNAFLRNYRHPEAYYMMKKYDIKLRDISGKYHDMLCKQYSYIKFLGLGGKFTFKAMGLLMKVYKRMSC